MPTLSGEDVLKYLRIMRDLEAWPLGTYPDDGEDEGGRQLKLAVLDAAIERFKSVPEGDLREAVDTMNDFVRRGVTALVDVAADGDPATLARAESIAWDTILRAIRHRQVSEPVPDAELAEAVRRCESIARRFASGWNDSEHDADADAICKVLQALRQQQAAHPTRKPFRPCTHGPWMGSLGPNCPTCEQEAEKPEADPALVEAVGRLLGGEPWDGVVDAAWALGARSICTEEEEADNQLVMDAANDDLEAAIETVLAERSEQDA